MMEPYSLRKDDRVVTKYSKKSKLSSRRTAASNKAVRGLLKRLKDVGL